MMDEIKRKRMTWESICDMDNTKLIEHIHKSEDELAELSREFDILEGACDFWKETAIDLGYEE